MKKDWKILLWTTLIILVVTNVFWLYITVDNAVGQSYYKVTCDEYYHDMIEFKKVLETQKTKNEIIDFLKDYEEKFDAVQKGNDLTITMNSFSITFDNKGNKKSED